MHETPERISCCHPFFGHMHPPKVLETLLAYQQRGEPFVPVETQLHSLLTMRYGFTSTGDVPIPGTQRA
jgi:hypothetical protein